MTVLAIPRQRRLRLRRDFAALSRGGRSYRGELVNLRARRTGESGTRLGFTASLAVGSAVTRNRAKRRLREIAGALPVFVGWHLVLSARPAAARASFRELAAEVERLLGRAGALAR